MNRLLTSLLLLVGMHAAHADIYKYVDEEGRVTYSNLPIKGAKRVDMEPLQSINAPKTRGEPAGSGSSGGARSNKGPEDFPKVDSETQKQRDGGRRKILEDELAAENKALAQAKKAFEEGQATRLGDERNNYQKYLDRVAGLKDAITLHEKNIAALQKELSR